MRIVGLLARITVGYPNRSVFVSNCIFNRKNNRRGIKQNMSKSGTRAVEEGPPNTKESMYFYMLDKELDDT